VPRPYGGQVAAQALLAAARTVDDDRQPHSLHSYFPEPGESNQPVVFAWSAIVRPLLLCPQGRRPAGTAGPS